ncbi:MAG: hypothetical protein RLY66_183 [Candidatus Parcubacteria bacterium]|jgi:hypothetical protein
MEKIILNQIRSLSKLQSKNGQFTAYTVTNKGDYGKTEAFFPSVFIASCLHNFSDTPEIKSILHKLANFSNLNRQKDYTWNYWVKKSDSFTNRRYPNDLDDTSLANLSVSSAKKLTRLELIGYLKNLKLSRNKKAFNTWILPKDLLSKESHWLDSDPVVNANILLTLRKLGIEIKFLEKYIENCIETGNFISKYYNPIHVIYMISRSYIGNNKGKLIKALSKAVSNKKLDNLTTSFILSSFIYLQAPSEIIEDWYYKLVNTLEESQQSKFFIESIKNDLTTFVISPAITHAATIEALKLYQKHKKFQTKEQPDIKLIQSFVKSKLNIPNELQSALSDSMYQIYSLNNIRKIIKIPRLLSKTLGTETADMLELAGLLGWTSYTIYDAIRDGSTDIKVIGKLDSSRKTALANYLMINFQKIRFELNLNPKYNKVIDEILRKMEEANFLENTPSSFDKVMDRSIWKSMGASIPVLMTISINSGSKYDIKFCERYFYNLIAARQLSDDAYDWMDDFSSKKITPVTMLFRSHKNRAKEFSEKISPIIAKKILNHSLQACDAAQKIKCLKNTGELTNLLSPYITVSTLILQKYSNKKIAGKYF